MHAKRKLAVSLLVMVFVLLAVVATLGIAFALTQQTINTMIDIGYTAVDIDGSVSGTYTIGGVTNYLEPIADAQHVSQDNTALIFKSNDQTSAGNLMFPESQISLSSANQDIVLRYTFTNTGDADYTAIMTFEDTLIVSENMIIEYSLDGSSYSTSRYGLVVTNKAPKSYWIRIKIDDITKNASFQASFSWVLENYEAKEGEEIIQLSALNYVGNESTGEYTATYNGEALNEGMLYIPSQVGSAQVTTITQNTALTAEQKAQVKNVVISQGVEEIGEYAFANYTNLEDVKFAQNAGTAGASVQAVSGLKTIGKYAFQKCAKLTSITIPKTCETIKERAFTECTTLGSVILQEGVSSIEQYAFHKCSNLIYVSVPKSISSIASYSFYNCSKLAQVVTPELKSWSGITFGNSYANPIYYAKSLYLATDKDTPISEITLTGIQTVSKYAFYNCASITKVKTGDDLTSVDIYAFSGCSGLLSVEFGKNIVNLGNNSFASCSKLNNITIPSTLSTMGTSVFSGCSGLKTVTIPNDMTELKASTFNNCTGLTEINIPDSITKIGSSCFSGCTGLTKVIVSSMEKWTSIEFGNSTANPLTCAKNLYLTSDLSSPVTSITFTQDITSKYAFEGCTSITSVTIAEGVTTLGDYSLYGFKGLRSLTLPSTLTKIGSYAFANCSNLTGLEIPNSVTSLGSYAFSGCSGLTSMTIPEGITSLSNYLFQNCTGLKSVTIPSSVTSLGSYTFSGCTGLTSFQIPSTITTIGYHLFNGCSNLTSIEIPNNVTKIETQAFYQCSKLTSITIPNSVQSIGKKAFMGCSKLTNLDLGNGVTTIYNSAFRSCSALTTVVIPASVTKIYGMVFASCTNLTNVTIESTNLEVSTHDGMGNDCKGIFEGCSNIVTTVYDNGKYIGNSTNPYMVLMSATSTDIASIQIHPQTKIINAKALYNCKSITEIVVPDSVEYICINAFSTCSAVTSITIGSGVKRIEHGAMPPINSITSIVFKDPNDWGIANGVRVNLTSYSVIYDYLYTKRYRNNNWDKGRTSSYGEGHAYSHLYK